MYLPRVHLLYNRVNTSMSVSELIDKRSTVLLLCFGFCLHLASSRISKRDITPPIWFLIFRSNYKTITKPQHLSRQVPPEKVVSTGDLQTAPAVLAVLCLTAVSGYSNRKVEKACERMLPQHHSQPNTTASPYIMTVSVSEFSPGEQIKVTLSGGEHFEGFLLQARDATNPDGSAIGSYTLIDPKISQLLETVHVCQMIMHHIRYSAARMIHRHTRQPLISTHSQVISGPPKILTGSRSLLLMKFQGALMLIGWMLAGSTGTLMASYFKPDWPEQTLFGQKIWFQCCSQLWALFFSFIYRQKWSSRAGAHPYLGCTVMIPAFCQPVMAAFRPVPDSSRDFCDCWNTTTVSVAALSMDPWSALWFCGGKNEDKTPVLSDFSGSENWDTKFRVAILAFFVLGNSVFCILLLDSITQI